MAVKRKLTKAKRGPVTKAHKKRRTSYIKHRAKHLRYAKTYYRKHKARILKRAKVYRRLTKNRGPFYKQNKPGGRYPRFKRMRRSGSKRRTTIRRSRK